LGIRFIKQLNSKKLAILIVKGAVFHKYQNCPGVFLGSHIGVKNGCFNVPVQRVRGQEQTHSRSNSRDFICHRQSASASAASTSAVPLSWL
jgi:hypothetical protein